MKRRGFFAFLTSLMFWRKPVPRRVGFKLYYRDLSNEVPSHWASINLPSPPTNIVYEIQRK